MAGAKALETVLVRIKRQINRESVMKFGQASPYNLHFKFLTVGFLKKGWTL